MESLGEEGPTLEAAFEVVDEDVTIPDENTGTNWEPPDDGKEPKPTTDTKDSNNGDSEEEEDDDDDDNDDIFEVESILRERTRKGIKEYFVRWKGFGPEHDTWEPEDNLNCEDIIEEFRRQTAKKETVEKRKRTPQKRRVNNDEEDDEDYKEEAPVRKKGKRGRGRPRKSVQKQPQERKRGNNSKTRKNTKEPPLVIRCKTIFKKHLIQNCIKSEDRRNPSDDDSPDVVVKYFLRYDIDSGEFFVGNIKVGVDEEKKCLVCTACCKTYGSLTMEQKLIPGKTPLQFWQMCRDTKLHIIGRHLEGFTCNLCDEPYGFHTRGASHYYHHMSQFHKGALKGRAITPTDQVRGSLEENEDESSNSNQNQETQPSNS